jgi:hypothetical protein
MWFAYAVEEVSVVNHLPHLSDEIPFNKRLRKANHRQQSQKRKYYCPDFHNVLTFKTPVKQNIFLCFLMFIK